MMSGLCRPLATCYRTALWPSLSCSPVLVHAAQLLDDGIAARAFSHHFASTSAPRTSLQPGRCCSHVTSTWLHASDNLPRQQSRHYRSAAGLNTIIDHHTSPVSKSNRRSFGTTDTFEATPAPISHTPSTTSQSHAAPAARPSPQPTSNAIPSESSIAAQGPESGSLSPAPLPAAPTYEELLDMEQRRLSGKAPPVLDPTSKMVIGRVLRTFCTSGAVQDKARSSHISTDLFALGSSAFRKFLLRAMTPELRDLLMAWGALLPAAEELLLQYLLKYVAQHYSSEVSHYAALVASSDMRQPHTWYPFARALKRKIVYHAGPTNSGKTYEALQALKVASSGVYCAPLRLLAMEVYDRLNADGVWCNLVTGQEKSILPNAEHTACTVEMANLNKKVDVAVVDEIQCIGDEYRGCAWTRAVLGLPANEIHVCGDMSAVQLVQHLCQEGGDEFEVRYYERFQPLAIDRSRMDQNFTSVRPGDCIVAFSRRRIFEIKDVIERKTPHRVCVVYGALPPETRREQARLFNDPESGWDVLVASDAVGMGLNLNIRRIVFDTVRKTIGGTVHLVPVTSLKQIAGRAGRRNTVYSQGYVACLDPHDMKVIQSAVDAPPESLSTPAAGLFPEWEQLELLAGQLPDSTFAGLLSKFATTTQMDGHYFFCNSEQMLKTARLLDRVPGLSLKDRYIFCLSPADGKEPTVMLALLQFAYSYAAGHPVTLDVPAPEQPPRDHITMKSLEINHKICSLWLWLSYRLEEGVFPGRERASQVLSTIAFQLNLGLQNMSQGRRKAGMLAGQEGQQREGEAGEEGGDNEYPDSGDATDSVQKQQTGAVSSDSLAEPGSLEDAVVRHRMPLVTDPSQWVMGFLDQGALLDPGVKKFVRMSGARSR